MAEKNKEYVEAAKAIGFSESTVLFRHILPNVMTPVIVIATLQVGTVILRRGDVERSRGLAFL